VWDVFAVSTYGTVSLIFWYVGLMPDVATLRDKAESKTAKVIYGIMALGWRGSARHWHRYQSAYLLLAGLATPLVVSVHTVVSFDFTIGLPAGWHTTIFPPYFVAGAIYSGFAMVLTLAIPIRAFYGLEDFITHKHLENSAKILLATGLIVTYGYAMEAFMAWYSGDRFEWYMTSWRATGGYRLQYWLLILCNVVSVQFLWFKRLRRNVPLLFLISFIINLGMWMERYVIVVTSLVLLPKAWWPRGKTEKPAERAAWSSPVRKHWVRVAAVQSPVRGGMNQKAAAVGPHPVRPARALRLGAPGGGGRRHPPPAQEPLSQSSLLPGPDGLVLRPVGGAGASVQPLVAAA